MGQQDLEAPEVTCRAPAVWIRDAGCATDPRGDAEQAQAPAGGSAAFACEPDRAGVPPGRGSDAEDAGEMPRSAGDGGKEAMAVWVGLAVPGCERFPPWRDPLPFRDYARAHHRPRGQCAESGRPSPDSYPEPVERSPDQAAATLIEPDTHTHLSATRPLESCPAPADGDALRRPRAGAQRDQLHRTRPKARATGDLAPDGHATPDGQLDGG